MKGKTKKNLQERGVTLVALVVSIVIIIILAGISINGVIGDGDLENGVGHLSVTQIPVATANAGYNQSSLSWTPETPTTTYEITGEMEFVAVFAPTPSNPQ